GVLGALATACVAYLLLRSWIATRFDLTFALVLAVWLVGITLITSCEQLLPVWRTLGWLTVWPEILASTRGGSAGDDAPPDGGAAAPGVRKSLHSGASREFGATTPLPSSHPLTPLRGWGRKEEHGHRVSLPH